MSKLNFNLSILTANFFKLNSLTNLGKIFLLSFAYMNSSLYAFVSFTIIKAT